MRLDIAADREEFLDNIISDVGFIRSSNTFADGFTEAMSQAALQSLVLSGIIVIKP